MTTYQYKPLDTSQPSIRLLKVTPGASKDSLEIEIHNAHLDKNPSYIALSYTWDQGQGTKSVRCNGSKIKVERNLYNFLRRFRASPLCRRAKLWIDALCIDQGNVAERNHQVAQMDAIYLRAASVISWLGETTDAECESLAQQIADAGEGWAGQHPPSKAVYSSMAHLLDKPYWSRMWVVQEFLLAPNVELWWGPHRANVTRIRGWVADLQPPETPGYAGFFSDRAWAYSSWGASQAWETRGRKLLQYRAKARAEAAFEESERRLVRAVRDGGFQGLKLRELLEAFDSSECTEKVDKVYALLGIASDVSVRRELIPVDYSKSAFEVLLDILRFQHRYRAEDDEERDLGWVISVSRRLGVVRGDLARYIFRESSDLELQALAFSVAVPPTVPVTFVGTILRHENTRRPERQFTAEDMDVFAKLDELPNLHGLSLSSPSGTLGTWPHNATTSLFNISYSKSLVSFIDTTLSAHSSSEPRHHDPTRDEAVLKQIQSQFFDTCLPILDRLPYNERESTKEERFVAQMHDGEIVYGTCPASVGDAVRLAVLDADAGKKNMLVLDPPTPGYANTHAVRGIAKRVHSTGATRPQAKPQDGDRSGHNVNEPHPQAKQSGTHAGTVQIQLSNCDMLDMLDLVRHQLLARNVLVEILGASWEADKKRPQRRFGLSVNENRVLEDWFALQCQC